MVWFMRWQIWVFKGWFFCGFVLIFGLICEVDTVVDLDLDWFLVREKIMFKWVRNKVLRLMYLFVNSKLVKVTKMTKFHLTVWRGLWGCCECSNHYEFLGHNLSLNAWVQVNIFNHSQKRREKLTYLFYFILFL